MAWAAESHRMSSVVSPGRRPRVQKNITSAIALHICEEKYPAGSALPRENDLCQLYGVSRTVIRESLKILESKGMVCGRPRIGTTVCDRNAWNLLDAQVLEWIGPRIFAFNLLDSILEARRTIEPDAAAFAARRATTQDIADLDKAWQEMRTSEGDIPRFTEADVAFHTILLKASHNQVFRQLSSIIEAALRYSLHASNEAAAKRDEALEVHGALIEALRMRDETVARHCSHRILDLAARDIGVATGDLHVTFQQTPSG